MESKKRALGRGLEELFNTETLDLDTIEKTIYESATNEEIVEIPLSELRANPYQPRKNFDDELKMLEQHEQNLCKAVKNIFHDSYEYTRQYRSFRKEMENKEGGLYK